jgi:ABC-type amino acid transport system permease subunit
VAFALLGVTSPSAVLGVIVGIVILSAAWLHAKLADSRPQWRQH